MSERGTVRVIATPLAVALLAAPLLAADLKPETIAAFDRYVRAAEAELNHTIADGPFLALDGLSAEQRQATLVKLRRGEVVIDRLTARENGRTIDVPSGLVHHWRGVVFVPGLSLPRMLAFAVDFDRYSQFFPEVVKRSTLVSRDGNQFNVAECLMLKSVLTGVANVSSDMVLTPVDSTHAYMFGHSTRVAEVADFDTPEEHEYAVGHDNGYLWRVNSYWLIEERDGGIYLQCEWISLSRGLPFGFGWVAGPIVRSLSHDSLEQMLIAARRAFTPSAP